MCDLVCGIIYSALFPLLSSGSCGFRRYTNDATMMIRIHRFQPRTRQSAAGRSDVLEWRLGEPVEFVVVGTVVLEARRAVLVVATAVEAARRTAGLRVGVVLRDGVGQVPELAAVDRLTVDTDGRNQCDNNNSTGFGELTIQSYTYKSCYIVVNSEQ